jgi:hypothetical protein
MNNIGDYFAYFKQVIKNYTDAGFILSEEINYEIRSDERGYLKGKLVWSDGSELHVREYLQKEETEFQPVMYVYHYQNAGSQLIFRYDNAMHRPALRFSNHKHVEDSIEEVRHVPTFEEVLQEVMTYLRFHSN